MVARRVNKGVLKSFVTFSETPSLTRRAFIAPASVAVGQCPSPLAVKRAFHAFPLRRPLPDSKRPGFFIKAEHRSVAMARTIVVAPQPQVLPPPGMKPPPGRSGGAQIVINIEERADHLGVLRCFCGQSVKRCFGHVAFQPEIGTVSRRGVSHINMAGVLQIQV